MDISTRQAYEIKPEDQILNGMAEINWYISIYNSNPSLGGPSHLVPGTYYKWAWEGWEVIGTNPYYAGQVILAQMKVSGVITYKGVNKDRIPVPLPRYVWEWDPSKNTVEKRDRTKIPNWLPNTAPAYSNIIDLCVKGIILIGTTYLILSPIPDDPLIPILWSLNQYTPIFP